MTFSQGYINCHSVNRAAKVVVKLGLGAKQRAVIWVVVHASKSPLVFYDALLSP